MAMGNDVRIGNQSHTKQANQRSDGTGEKCCFKRLIWGTKCMRDEKIRDQRERERQSQRCDLQ